MKLFPYCKNGFEILQSVVLKFKYQKSRFFVYSAHDVPVLSCSFVFNHHLHIRTIAAKTDQVVDDDRKDEAIMIYPCTDNDVEMMIDMEFRVLHCMGGLA